MIRSFTLVALILLIGNCFSQVTPSRIFHLDSIPKKGVKLTQGWLFHPGDNREWAAVNYDDTNSGWQPINPTFERHYLPQVQEAGVCWLRLKMKVDSSLLNKSIAMTLTIRGVAEVYLNGELIYKFGTVSPEYALEKTRSIFYRPYTLQLGDKAIQELAIRHSFHKKNFYVNIGDNPVVLIYLKSSNQAFVDFMRFQGFFQNLRFIQLSFYLPFGLLMLFLYFSYRLRREYLYIGTYAVSMFVCMLLQVLGERDGITSNLANFCLFFSQLFGFFGMVLFLRGIYLLYKQSSNWIFYLILVGALMIIPGFLFVYAWVWILHTYLTPLIIIEFLRSSIKAYKQNRAGSLIMVKTAIVCLILIIVSIVLHLLNKQKEGYVIYSLCFVIPPIGLTLFFSGEFARTGLALQSRLKEVEQLSKKTIYQEREKQQILSSLNETLEQQILERTNELMEQRQALEMEREAKLLAEFNRRFSESELKALRSQMNPHFVFNILNTIESYALENNKEAVSEMIQKFSRLTRLVLENSMNQLVPFENDWKSLQLYIELEQMRYADKFLVVYNVDEKILEENYLIPPMIIQPFVENAIIHGLRNMPDHAGQLNLTATLEDQAITVRIEDNGIGRSKSAHLKLNSPIKKNSLGIKVTQDRISIFNNINQHKKATIHIYDLAQGTRVEISLPIT